MKVVKLEDIQPEGVSHDAAIMKSVLLQEAEVPGSVRLSHASFKAGQRVSLHNHEDICEVFYILSGHGKFVVDGRAVEVAEGSCIRVDAGEMHELVNTGEEKLTMLYFGLKV